VVSTVQRTELLDAGDLGSTPPTSTPEAAPGGPRASFSVVDAVDGYTRSVAGVRVEAVRTGLGTGPNRVLTVQDDGFMFTSSDIGFPLRTRTTVGDDHVIVGCVDAAPPGSRWCEVDLRPGTTVAYGPGAAHTGISPPGLRFKFATIEADRLAELAEQIESPLGLPSRGQVREFTSAPNARAVLSSMLELDAAASDGPTSLQSRCDAVLGDVVLALTEAARSTPARGPGGISSRHVVHQCMDFADAVGRIPSISELCLAARVSERRLRQAFVDEYDLPPSRFFRDWALTLAHQRLRSADDDRHTVTDVAVDLGFSHLGRFSGHYRKLYGESPSTTLRSACGSS
jgi:AraC-like DNA-binding protein